MSIADLTPYLSLVGAVLGAVIAGFVGAYANGRTRRKEERKARDQELKGLLLLIHGELHHNQFLLDTLRESPDFADDTWFTNFQTEVWVDSRVRLAQLLSKEHMAALVMYYTRLNELIADIPKPNSTVADEETESLADSADATLTYSESAMRYGVVHVFDDPDFRPSVNDAFVQDTKPQVNKDWPF